ncbi:hypothetical protein GVN18_38490 [Pseudomonas sp. ODNR1LW]|nr:hypothetical protein [Pseudomonas sp. ODNR1LW]
MTFAKNGERLSALGVNLSGAKPSEQMMRATAGRGSGVDVAQALTPSAMIKAKNRCMNPSSVTPAPAVTGAFFIYSH